MTKGNEIFIPTSIAKKSFCPFLGSHPIAQYDNRGNILSSGITPVMCIKEKCIFYDFIENKDENKTENQVQMGKCKILKFIEKNI